MQIITSLVTKTITVLYGEGRCKTFTIEEAEELLDMLGGDRNDFAVKLEQEIIRLKG